MIMKVQILVHNTLRVAATTFLFIFRDLEICRHLMLLLLNLVVQLSWGSVFTQIRVIVSAFLGRRLLFGVRRSESLNDLLLVVNRRRFLR